MATGRTGYTAPTNANAPTGPSQMADIYKWFDDRIDLSVANQGALPSTGNWVGRQAIALDTKILYINTDGATTWVAVTPGQWTTYTPTWTASTTNPTPGSSTLHGKYRLVGKTVEFEIYLQIAAGTGQGSGNWRFAIPVAPSGDRVPVLVHIENATVGFYAGVGYVDTNQYVDQIVFNGTAVLGSGSGMNANSKISIRGSYEIA